MRNFVLGVLAAATAAMGAASAAVDVFLWEDGSDLRLQAEGTLDLTGLTFNGTANFVDGLLISAPNGWLGASTGPTDRYDLPGSTPPAFGTGSFNLFGTFTGTNSFFTDEVGANTGIIWVSSGFQSGDSIFAAGIAENESLASVGADIGVYVWTLPNDTVTFRIGTAPNAEIVPVPPALALFGAGALTFLRKTKRS
ncbi:MAG: hypothetical protein AAGH41_01165 [Pseudomonadota bacterium]